NGVINHTTSAPTSLTDTFNPPTSPNRDKGDTITVDVTPNDGTVDGTMVSDTATVINTAPVATVSLNKNNPTTNETLTATATKSEDRKSVVKGKYVEKVNG